MQLLDFVDGADGDRAVGGERQAVGVGLGVERTHVLHFSEVDVGKDELLGGRVDDRRPVGAGKHVHR